MIHYKCKIIISTICYILFSIFQLNACSSYKISIDSTTILGSNFDAYYTSPQIWIETAKKSSEYGAIFSGGRYENKIGYSPQSGMNEAGLAFSRLAALTSKRSINFNRNKKSIVNPIQYLKDILHLFNNIEDVKNYINQYNHQIFNEDVFIYVEKSGNYLIVEPDTCYIGVDKKYVLSNFCPSQTTEIEALKLERYKNGVQLLQQKMDTSFSFCCKLSNAMHVCRKKMGDGTLLTSICNLKNGIIQYYFYHDYKQVITFNLKDELRKGDTIYEVAKLFPKNDEFEKFIHYKTPQNYASVRYLLWILASILLVLTCLIGYLYLKNSSVSKNLFNVWIMAILNLPLAIYLLLLIKKNYIFYFSAPYKDYTFSIHTILAYLPFILAIIIIPIMILYYKNRKEYSQLIVLKWAIITNLFIYILLVFLFYYWGLYTA